MAAGLISQTHAAELTEAPGEAGPGQDALPTADPAALRERVAALLRGELCGPVELRGASLIDADLSGVMLAGADLRGANLSRANLSGTMLLGANLAGAVLYGAKLDGTELTGADLTGANLEHVVGQRVGLGGAKLSHTSWIGSKLESSTLTGADLSHAVASGVQLLDCRMHGAVLNDADLTRSALRECDLARASVRGAALDGADLRGAHLDGVTGYESASWLSCDIRDINFSGAYLLRRHVMDENYLHEFRNRSTGHHWLYRLWSLTSDCGRSLSRWALLVLVLTVFFAALFTLVEMDYGSHQTWLSPLYYSVVTITTLGYGDVLPADTAAQVVAMAEVVTGYMMLGGLLSIFSNKMARRAD